MIETNNEVLVGPVYAVRNSAGTYHSPSHTVVLPVLQHHHFNRELSVQTRMKQHIREMWARRTKDTPWEHFVTVNEKHYLNGLEVEPYDFEEIHATAALVDDYREDIIDVFDAEDSK
jgi:hypothetical protein